MNIDYPTPGQISGLRRLWKAAFGDSEEFLDSFFSLAYSPRRCRCVTEENEPAAALYWFETECGGRKFAYLYAVATDAAYRNRGLCRTLMEDTGALLKVRGFDALLLVPENEALARMYEKMGFLPCTAVSEFSCEAGDSPAVLRQIDRAEYARLRRGLLPTGGVVQEGADLAFLAARAGLYAGDGWIAAAERDGEKLHCHELLGDRKAASGILRAMDCREGFFRTPGQDRPFGWYLPLTQDCPKPGYFGLALD